MIARSVTSEAPAAAVWELLSRPACWSHWAPHVRGGRGIGQPEVQAGRRGLVMVGPGFAVTAVPVLITGVEPGRSWSWRVAGVVDMDHVVQAGSGGGSRVTIEMRAPIGVELGLRVAYAPLVETLLRRLARAAADQ